MTCEWCFTGMICEGSILREHEDGSIDVYDLYVCPWCGEQKKVLVAEEDWAGNPIPYDIE